MIGTILCWYWSRREPDAYMLAKSQPEAWAFCTENHVDRWLDCTIGVRQSKAYESPVSYEQVENWYRGRYGQIGDVQLNKSGLQLIFGSRPHFWDGPDVATILSIDKPQFTVGMTPFYIREEYSLYLRVKYLTIR